MPLFSRPVLALLLVLLLGAGCGGRITPEEKALRAELRQALREGSYEKAVELGQRLVAASPRESGAWERLARAQIGLGDFAAAKQTLERWRAVVRKTPPEFDELSGDIAKGEKDVPAAIASWNKALAADAKNLGILGKIAHAQHEQGHWTETEATLTAMLGIEEDATVRMKRALGRRRLHRWTDALEDFRRAQEVGPEEPEVRRGAKLFERLGTFLGEIRKLDARLAVTPEDDQLLADRALLFLRSDDAELALEDSAAATRLAPSAMLPRLFSGLALRSLDRPMEAEKLGLDPRLRLEALSPQFLETLSRLDAEISVDRKNAELHVARAWQLNEIEQPLLALEDAENAARLEVNAAGAYAEAGYAHARLGRPDQALEQLKRATELDPNFATAWHYRGELEMRGGDYSAAVESLSRALAIEPTPVVLQKREECYMRMGLLAKAEEDHRALEALHAKSLQ